MGRLIALWISAFEILAHDGKNSGLNQVCRFLEGLPPRGTLRRAIDGRTIRRWVYQRLYAARNDFLHGNEIADDATRVPSTPYDLSHFGAPLYRLMLTEYLPVRLSEPEVDMTAPKHVERLVEQFSTRRDFMEYEEACERALQRLHDLYTGKESRPDFHSTRSDADGRTK
jgi:hypothetical protein